jgi:hypothetical protein
VAVKTKPLDLGTYLKEKQSPLADHVPALMRASNRWRVDPRLLVAISGGESSFGRVIPGGSFNAWGIGPGHRYASWEDGLNAAAKLLRTNYIGKGLKNLAAIGAKWAPQGAANDPTNLNSNWYRNNSAIYTALGGNPGNVMAGWRKMAAPAAVKAMPSQKQVSYAPLGAPPKLGQLDETLEQVAFENLGAIARGESPTGGLRRLVEANLEVEAAKSAARVTANQTEGPRLAPVVSPDTQKVPSAQQKATNLKAGGGWGGSYSIAKAFADTAKGLGLSATSEKRSTRMTKSGNTSDHWEGSKDAYAYDLSNGSAPTPQMDAAAQAIARMLGVKYDGKSELNLTKVINGYRVQVLYRTQVGGNHFDHVHVGVRRYGG